MFDTELIDWAEQHAHQICVKRNHRTGAHVTVTFTYSTGCPGLAVGASLREALMNAAEEQPK